MIESRATAVDHTGFFCRFQIRAADRELAAIFHYDNRLAVPRIIALSILNGFGVRALNDLPVTAFALDDESKKFLTATYSFALATNFRPLADYKANIRAVRQPVSVVAGTDDEAFYLDKFQPIFEQDGKNWPVTLLPGIGHIPLTLEKRAVDAAVAAVGALRGR